MAAAATMRATRRLTQAGLLERIEGHLYEDYKHSFDAVVEAARTWLMTAGKATLLGQPVCSTPGPANVTTIAALARCDKRRRCGGEAPYTPVLVVAYEPPQTPTTSSAPALAPQTPMSSVRRTALPRQPAGARVMQAAQVFEAVAAAQLQQTPSRSKPPTTKPVLHPQQPIVAIAPLPQLPVPQQAVLATVAAATTAAVTAAMAVVTQQARELKPQTSARLEPPEHLLRSPAPLPVTAAAGKPATVVVPNPLRVEESTAMSMSGSLSAMSDSDSVSLSVSQSPSARPGATAATAKPQLPTSTVAESSQSQSQTKERCCPICHKTMPVELYASHVRALTCKPQPQQQRTPEPQAPPPPPTPQTAAAVQRGMPIGALAAAYTTSKPATPVAMPPVSAAVLARPPLPPVTAAQLQQQQQPKKKTSGEMMPPPAKTPPKPKKSPQPQQPIARVAPVPVPVPAMPTVVVAMSPARQAVAAELAASQSSTSSSSSSSSSRVQYEIEPFHDSDEEDESYDSEEERKKKSKIPPWAKGERLMRALMRQETVDPDRVFSCAKSCNLDDIFGSMAASKRKRAYRQRTSSGNWQADLATWREELEYKRAMGFSNAS